MALNADNKILVVVTKGYLNLFIERFIIITLFPFYCFYLSKCVPTAIEDFLNIQKSILRNSEIILVLANKTAL